MVEEVHLLVLIERRRGKHIHCPLQTNRARRIRTGQRDSRRPPTLLSRARPDLDLGMVNETSTYKFRSRDSYNTFRLQCSNSSRPRPSAPIADAAQAAQLPALVGRDQVIAAPHRRRDGVEISGTRA